MYSRLLLLLILPLHTFAQVGGESTFEFLNLPASARIMAMGGNLISIRDDDPNLMTQNPALLNRGMHNRISASTVAYLAKINYGYIGYARHYDSLDLTLSAGMLYVAYGKFIKAEPNGIITGEFSAGEYALHMGASRQRDRFTYGASLKVIYSILESYYSWGLAADVGVTYTDTANGLNLSAVLKNVGRQLVPYREKNFEPLPFDMQIGLAKTLKYLPLTASLIYHDLHRWDIRYNDPNAAVQELVFDSSGADIKEKKYTIDKFFRHMIFAGEMRISQHLKFQLAYNHQRRKELTIDGRKGLTGFSMGVGIKVKQFEFAYGRAAYHVAGASNHFSVSTNMSDFKSKTKQPGAERVRVKKAVKKTREPKPKKQTRPRPNKEKKGPKLKKNKI